MRGQRGFAGARGQSATSGGPVGLRLGLWALLAAVAGACAAYALKRRHDMNVFERRFDPDAELQASIIPPVEHRPASEM